jgi:hypothetical protein
MTDAGGPVMSGSYLALAVAAALNPKLLAVDLVLTENRRPRAMFLCVLLGGLTVALTIGLLDVLVLRADAITSQKTVSAGVDLAMGLLLLAAGGWSPRAVCTAGGRWQGRRGAGSRRSRSRTQRAAGHSGCWLSPGSGSPCWSAR